MELKSFDFIFKWSSASTTILTIPPNEAFAVLHMKAFMPFISEVVPNYGPVENELSEVPQE